MTPTEYMQAAINDAKAREAEVYHAGNPRIFAGHCWGGAETPIGKISVEFVVAQGRTTYRPEHMRQTWKLDGKRIARDKMIAALRQA